MCVPNRRARRKEAGEWKPEISDKNMQNAVSNQALGEHLCVRSNYGICSIYLVSPRGGSQELLVRVLSDPCHVRKASVRTHVTRDHNLGNQLFGNRPLRFQDRDMSFLDLLAVAVVSVKYTEISQSLHTKRCIARVRHICVLRNEGPFWDHIIR